MATSPPEPLALSFEGYQSGGTKSTARLSCLAHALYPAGVDFQFTTFVICFVVKRGTDCWRIISFVRRSVGQVHQLLEKLQGFVHASLLKSGERRRPLSGFRLFVVANSRVCSRALHGYGRKFPVFAQPENTVSSYLPVWTFGTTCIKIDIRVVYLRGRLKGGVQHSAG